MMTSHRTRIWYLLALIEIYWRLNIGLSGLDQEPDPAHAIPGVSVESKCQFDPRRQRLGAAKPDAVDWLPLVLELEGQVLFTDQALRNDFEFFAERWRGQTRCRRLAAPGA